MKVLKKLPRFLCHIYALFTVMIGWTLFFFEDMTALFGFFGKMFSISATSQQGINLILGFLPLMIVAMIASTPLAKKLFVRGEDNAARGWGRRLVTAVLMVLCVAALASQSYNPFIYFRF